MSNNFRKQWFQFALPPAMHESSSCPTFLPVTTTVHLFNFTILVDVSWYFIAILIWISQNTNQVESIFMFLDIWISSFMKCLFKSHPFLYWTVCHFLQTCILDMSPLLIICIAISSPTQWTAFPLYYWCLLINMKDLHAWCFLCHVKKCFPTKGPYQFLELLLLCLSHLDL